MYERHAWGLEMSRQCCFLGLGGGGGGLQLVALDVVSGSYMVFLWATTNTF